MCLSFKVNLNHFKNHKIQIFLNKCTIKAFKSYENPSNAFCEFNQDILMFLIWLQAKIWQRVGFCTFLFQLIWKSFHKSFSSMTPMPLSRRSAEGWGCFLVFPALEFSHIFSKLCSINFAIKAEVSLPVFACRN